MQILLQAYLKGFIENWIKCLLLNCCFEFGFLVGIRKQVDLNVGVGGTALAHNCKLDGTVDVHVKLVIFVLNSNENFTGDFIVPSCPPRYGNRRGRLWRLLHNIENGQTLSTSKSV